LVEERQSSCRRAGLASRSRNKSASTFKGLEWYEKPVARQNKSNLSPHEFYLVCLPAQMIANF
jgi:hypothetical protein